jgi:hypothetical protein
VVTAIFFGGRVTNPQKSHTLTPGVTLFALGVTVSLETGPDRATLERRTKRLCQRVKDLGAEVRLLRWEQRAGWLAAAPLRRTPLSWRGQPVESGTVARTYPFSAGTLVIEGGVAASAPVTFTTAAAPRAAAYADWLRRVQVPQILARGPFSACFEFVQDDARGQLLVQFWFVDRADPLDSLAELRRHDVPPELAELRSRVFCGAYQPVVTGQYDVYT